MFERWLNPRPGSGPPPSPLTKLQVGECYFIPEMNWKIVYKRIYSATIKSGYSFEYQKCVNGYLIRRCKDAE